MDMNDLPPIFGSMIAKDDRVYLVKRTVNTLLASSLANEKNGYFKLTDEQVAEMRRVVKDSNRFDDEEKVAFAELVEVCLKNPFKSLSLSITFGPEGTAMDAITTYKSMVESDPRKDIENATPLDFGDLNWRN